VEHWAVPVITPHNRLNLGPTQALQLFLQQVAWINLEELSRQPSLDPLLNLLTLPIRPESELQNSSREILANRPDLDKVVVAMLCQRLPKLTNEQIMVIAGIPLEEIRHTRAVQDWLAEGRQEGEAAVTLRQLNRRCGPLSETTTARIQALPVDKLEALADALLDFQGPADLAAWLAGNI
jgi:predicted transposase YdaD